MVQVQVLQEVLVVAVQPLLEEIPPHLMVELEELEPQQVLIQHPQQELVVEEEVVMFHLPQEELVVEEQVTVDPQEQEQPEQLILVVVAVDLDVIQAVLVDQE